MKKISMKNKSNLTNFFHKYSYYIILSICILSVGITGWHGIKKIIKPPIDPILTTLPIEQKKEDNKEEKKVDMHINGIEKESTITKSEQEIKSEATKKTLEIDNHKTTLSSESLNVAAGKPYETYFMAPIGNGISKPYSNGELVYSETMNDWRVHNGTDFKAEKGMPIKSITEGIVLDVREDILMGVIVEVNHGNNVIARYCGLNKNPPIKKNDNLKIGQTIGTIGKIPFESTERPHLHLEISINGKLIDPSTILNIN